MTEMWIVDHTVQFRGKPMRCTHTTNSLGDAMTYAKLREKKGSKEIKISGYELTPIDTFDYSGVEQPQ